MTWGYREGDPGNYPGDTFTAMQLRLAEGYSELGTELSAPVAPVGLAWAEALQREPALDLWDGDGEHPNAAGVIPRRVRLLRDVVR
jgi:lysophospholipase L1-like esterase